MMKKQKTFYNGTNATEWLNNIAKAFKITKATINYNEVTPTGWDNGQRWTVQVSFK